MEVLLKISEEKMWEAILADCRIIFAENALNASLRGELYPSGSEQIELAITLAEQGLSEEIISKITRLNPEVFESFLIKK